MSGAAPAPRRPEPGVDGARTALPAAGVSDPIVRLFADGTGAAAPAEDAEEDWSASLAIVRGVATRVREVHRSARDAVRKAQQAAREAEATARAAEERTRDAESALREAVLRAEHAEERARLAEERSNAADARAGDARAWLQRMHACMLDEFGSLAAGDGALP